MTKEISPSIDVNSAGVTSDGSLGRRRRYQESDSRITLREGLEEYLAANPNLFKENEVAPASARFFHSHDRCHVVFGLDTSLEQEILADTWTVLGVDISLRDYLSYLKLPETVNILREIGCMRSIRETVKAIPKIVAVWRRARRMSRKWPWTGNDAYLDVPLADIRAEFNIEIG